VLVALVIFFSFTILVLPAQSQQAENASPGAMSPDLAFYYTADDLYKSAEVSGEQGRRAYVRARFSFDVAWPLVYTFFLTTSISWLLKRGLPTDSPWMRLNLLPLGAMLFDFLENSATSLVMLRYPSPTPVVDALAGPLTSLKWLLVAASIVALLAAMGLALLKGVCQRRAA
jgi:hypothetical protein